MTAIVHLNGRARVVKAGVRATHAQLCGMAGVHGDATVVWYREDGTSGTVQPGASVEMRDGMKINADHTGSA